MESQDTRDREINALMKANKKLEADTLLIITFDREETLEVNNTKIRVIPAWKWMLRTA